LIVTCESCKSRYKLDDARITGRGAKITCPRCKTVFVVYARDTAAPAAAVPPPPVDEDDEDEPTRQGAQVDVAAALRGHASTTHEVSAPTTAAPADMAARAAALDFKQVGVSMWKVKVKIGLIYDFSDLKTLRKYITDGRVTPADVISHDGKAWRQIGEIPDLDGYFVETWEKLAEARKDAPPPEPPPKKTPPPAELDIKKAEAEATRFTDPFEEQRKKAESKGGRKTSPTATGRGKDGKEPANNRGSADSGAKTGALAAAAVVVLALAGGAWFMTRAPAPPAPPTTPTATAPARPAAPTPTPTPSPTVDPTIQQISSDLAAAQDRAPALPSAEEEEARVLIPVRRDGTGVPEGARAVKPSEGATTGSSAMKTSAASAADHEQAGDAEAAAGKWSTAASAYRKAVSLDTKSANLQFKLGNALYRAKDDSASGALETAARLGRADAYRLLGDIAAEQGDVSGAMSRYQQYLKTKPKDAAEIERRMRELSGSGG
jgi:predicted Zn finger-like uncharacterized protein